MKEKRREWYFKFEIVGNIFDNVRIPKVIWETCLDKKDSNLFGCKLLRQRECNKQTYFDAGNDIVFETYDTEFEIKAENKLTADSIDVLIKVLSGIKKELTQWTDRLSFG